MTSTFYRKRGHYMRDIVAPNRTFQLPPKNMIIDGTHFLVECPTKPTFNIPEAKSMTHIFRQIKG
jgi:hypothetical protein